MVVKELFRDETGELNMFDKRNVGMFWPLKKGEMKEFY